MKRLAIGAATAALCALLVACHGDPGPKCLEWENRVRTVHVWVNGKYVPQVQLHQECVRYEEPSREAGK